MIFIHNSVGAIKISDISLKNYKKNKLITKRRLKSLIIEKIERIIF